MIAGAPIPDRLGPFEHDFWAALDRGRLAIQNCATCHQYSFPPRWRCQCGGALSYCDVSGRGRVWSFIEVYPPVLEAFKAFTPYVAAVIELEEQVGLRISGNLFWNIGDPINTVLAHEIMIGMPVCMTVAELAPGLTWPHWIPTELESE